MKTTDLLEMQRRMLWVAFQENKIIVCQFSNRGG